MIQNNDAGFDLVVIGAGPGGYVGAVRAAQLGMTVACIEAGPLGGVCLNWGCIPTKALLAQADAMTDFLTGPLGQSLNLSPAATDWPALITHKNQVVERLNKAVAHLFKQHHVTSITGRATITAAGEPAGPNDRPCAVEVCDEHGQIIERLRAARLLVATGARPRALPIAPTDGRRIIHARQALTLAHPPRSALVIGSGAIGVEFASLFASFGAAVTIVELLDRIVPNEDREISATLAKLFRRRKIKTFVGHKLTALHGAADHITATVEPSAGGSSQTLEADIALVAIGVTANTDGLFAETLAIDRDQAGCLLTDRDGEVPTYQTTLPGVYAVGDLIGPPYLAHVASAEAMACVERLAGRTPYRIDYTAIPACTYCSPQIASIGATEQYLAEHDRRPGRDYLVGRHPFTGHGMAVAIGHNVGLVKLIADAQTHILIGGHLIGHHVTEMIGELAVAMRLGATMEDLAATVHPHPTMAEAIREAALNCLNPGAPSSSRRGTF